jgi:hypothetical protein
MGHVCLLDERGDNGTFTNTLWEVQFKFGNKDETIEETRTVTD